LIVVFVDLRVFVMIRLTRLLTQHVSPSATS